MSVKRVGILTGGGDCPGLNAVIRAIVRKGIMIYDYEMTGVQEGWRGMLEGLSVPLDLDAVSGILPRGGHNFGIVADKSVSRWCRWRCARASGDGENGSGCADCHWRR